MSIDQAEHDEIAMRARAAPSHKLRALASAALFCALHLAAYLDPQNKLGVRQPLLALCLFPWILHGITVACNPRRNIASLVLAYLLPAVGTATYLLRGVDGNGFADTSYYSFAIVCGATLYFSQRPWAFRTASIAAVASGVFFSLLVCYTAVEFSVLDSKTVTNFAISNDLARVSFRTYGSVRLPYVYYFASSLLVLPISIVATGRGLRLFSLNSGAMLLMLVAFFLSGTRSHMLLTLVPLAVIAVRLRPGARTMVLAIPVVVVLLGGGKVLGSMLDSGEATNSQKLAMLPYYVGILHEPATVLVGQGFQAVDWDMRFKRLVNDDATKTEWTFLELLRVFGIPMGLLATLVLLRPVIDASVGAAPSQRLALGLLLADSLANPHLFSTYGAVIVAFGLAPQLGGMRRVERKGNKAAHA